MSKMVTAFAALFLSCVVHAFPLPNPNQFQTLADLPGSFTTDYDFTGIVRLNNCSGSLIRFEHSLDTDPAMVLSNGHCLEIGFPRPGNFVYGRASSRRFGLMNSSAQIVGNVTATMIMYATMTGTDMSLYRLRETYAEIQAQYGIPALTLSSAHPELAQPIEVISGYWRRGYSCATEAFISQLREDAWTMTDSIRYSRPGCEVIGGTSGSPIVAAGTRTVIGVNNTTNESGRQCTMNNPCEVDANGSITFTRGFSYGQQTYQVYTCLNANREIDLATPGCQLFH